MSCLHQAMHVMEEYSSCDQPRSPYHNFQSKIFSHLKHFFRYFFITVSTIMEYFLSNVPLFSFLNNDRNLPHSLVDHPGPDLEVVAILVDSFTKEAELEVPHFPVSFFIVIAPQVAHN